MSSSDDKPQPDRVPQGKPATARKPNGGRPASLDQNGRDQDMGAALRSVYQRAVDEKVPDDLMDLLGKLG